MKVKVLLIVPIAVLVALVVFYIQTDPFASKGVPLDPTTPPVTKEKITEEKATDDQKLVLNEQIQLFGILRKSGLSQEQKDRMQLNSDYIIQTTPSQIETVPYYFAYLDSAAMPATNLEGKCVEVLGTLDMNSVNAKGLYNNERTLGGIVLLKPVVLAIPVENCASVIGRVSRPAGAAIKTLTLNGEVQRLDRPSPDIGYDYILETQSNIPEIIDMSGKGREIKSVVLTPGDFEAYKALENNIGKLVTVSGYIIWGWAESQHFIVESMR